jgi:hypothetical protein
MLYRHYIFSSVARANTDSAACWFECNLADHAATASAIESVDAESVHMQQAWAFTGPGCLAAWPMPAARTAGQGAFPRPE